MKAQLAAVFRAVLHDLDVRTALRGETAAAVRALAAGGPLLVLAFGKAARPMATAVRDLLPGAALRGLVVPPAPDAAPLPPFEVLPGGHPLPDAGSLAAGRRALELAQGVAPAEAVLFLVSGGGSALLELPGVADVPLEDLRTLHQALVGSGADIAAINTVRRHLSAVKGGRLARAAAGARAQCTLAISDVPAGDLAALASGPTVPDPTAPAAARAVLDRHGLWPAVPARLRDALASGALPPPLLPGDPLLQRASWHVLQDERLAAALAQRRLAAQGVLAVVEPPGAELPVALAADRLLQRLDRLRRRHPGRPVAVVATGEVAVPLPPTPGRGGRNQQFALHCARRIRGRPIAVLSAGTDGIDGNSPAAGAVVDGLTAGRARRAGRDLGAALAGADAFPLLQALGDTVATGPTGTNVRDLRLLLHRG